MKKRSKKTSKPSGAQKEPGKSPKPHAGKIPKPGRGRERPAAPGSSVKIVRLTGAKASPAPKAATVVAPGKGRLPAAAIKTPSGLKNPAGGGLGKRIRARAVARNPVGGGLGIGPGTEGSDSGAGSGGDGTNPIGGGLGLRLSVKAAKKASSVGGIVVKNAGVKAPKNPTGGGLG